MPPRLKARANSGGGGPVPKPRKTTISFGRNRHYLNGQDPIFELLHSGTYHFKDLVNCAPFSQKDWPVPAPRAEAK